MPPSLLLLVWKGLAPWTSQDMGLPIWETTLHPFLLINLFLYPGLQILATPFPANSPPGYLFTVG